MEKKLEKSEKLESFSRFAPLNYLFHFTTQIVLAFTLLLMLHSLSSRYYWRMELNSFQSYTLSPRSLQLIQSFQKPLELLSIQEQSQKREFVRYRQQIQDLLEEYASHNPSWISVSHWNYHRENHKVEQLSQELARFGIKEGQILLRNSIVLRYQGHFRVLSFVKFFDINTEGNQEFKGEDVLSSALYSLLSQRQYQISFLQDHGELDIHSDSPEGLSLLKMKLLQENFLVETLSLKNSPSLSPQKIDLLVIPRPSGSFSEAELQSLAQYLDAGGKMMIFVDDWSNTPLNSVLKPRGIFINSDRITDPVHSGYASPRLKIQNWKEPHPITHPFTLYSGYSAYWDGVCSLQVDSENKEFHAQSFACTENHTQASSFQHLKPYHTGSFIVAALSQSLSMRLAVFGDSDFIRNGDPYNTQQIGIQDGIHTDLFFNTLQWCLQEEQQFGVRAKPIDMRSIQLDSDTAQKVGFLLCVFIPLLTIAFYWTLFGWTQTPSFQKFFDLFEEILARPTCFFTESLHCITLPQAFRFCLENVLFFGIPLYLLTSHLLFPYILQSADFSELKPLVKPLVSLETQTYHWLKLQLIDGRPEEIAQRKPDLPSAIILHTLLYLLLTLGFSTFVLALSALFLLLQTALLWIILYTLQGFKQAPSGKGLLKIISLSAFALPLLFPPLAIYTFSLLFLALHHGQGFSRKASFLGVLSLFLLQIPLFAFAIVPFIQACSSYFF
jgi:hypothetical protein